MTCNADGKGKADAADPIDRLSARPDFRRSSTLAPRTGGQTITKEMNLPPTFMAVGDDDKFGAMLASHYLALDAGVSTEIHIYAKTARLRLQREHHR